MRLFKPWPSPIFTIVIYLIILQPDKCLTFFRWWWSWLPLSAFMHYEPNLKNFQWKIYNLCTVCTGGDWRSAPLHPEPGRSAHHSRRGSYLCCHRRRPPPCCDWAAPHNYRDNKRQSTDFKLFSLCLQHVWSDKASSFTFCFNMFLAFFIYIEMHIHVVLICLYFVVLLREVIYFIVAVHRDYDRNAALEAATTWVLQEIYCEIEPVASVHRMGSWCGQEMLF